MLRANENYFDLIAIVYVDVRVAKYFFIVICSAIKLEINCHLNFMTLLCSYKKTVKISRKAALR